MQKCIWEPQKRLDLDLHCKKLVGSRLKVSSDFDFRRGALELSRQIPFLLSGILQSLRETRAIVALFSRRV